MKKVLMTKKVFMSIPEGTHIMSNIFFDRNTPMFSEKISNEREKQWKTIVSRGCYKRYFHIFENDETSEDFFKRIKTPKRDLSDLKVSKSGKVIKIY